MGVTAAARLVGVAPGTLRSWQRRYGLGPTGHQAGAHHRYGPRDQARLELMHQALLHGYTTADAARFALTVPATDLDDPSSPVDVQDILPGAGRSRTGTTPTLPMPGAGPAAAGLARAVLALDTLGAHTILTDQIELVGPLQVWEDVVRPVMNAIATRWAATGRGVEVKHLLSETVATTFAHAEMAAPPPRSTATVLLAAAPGEHHYLPLRILAAVLRHRGVRTTVLDGDVPQAALTATITRTGPRAVLLWAQLDANADLATLDRLPVSRPVQPLLNRTRLARSTHQRPRNTEGSLTRFFGHGGGGGRRRGLVQSCSRGSFGDHAVATSYVRTTRCSSWRPFTPSVDSCSRRGCPTMITAVSL